MRTVTLRIYGIRELAPEARKKALDYNRDINLEAGWSEAVTTNWTLALGTRGFKNAVIYWSGFGAGMEGACFDADVDVVPLFNDYVEHITENGSNLLPLIRRHRSAFLQAAKEAEFTIIRFMHDARIHARARVMHINNRRTSGTIFNTFYAEFSSFVENFRLSLCNEFFDDLRKEYISKTDDDAVMESLEAAGSEFFEDGSLYDKGE